MARVGRRSTQKEVDRKRTTRWVALGVAIAVVLIAGVVFLARPQPVEPLSIADDPTIGNTSAPVTAFLFADYQCPYCRNFETGGALARLERDYVTPGKVLIVWKDFAFIGEDSWHAAVASDFVWRTAPASWSHWNQGLFGIQGAERSGWASVDNLVSYSAKDPTINASALRDVLVKDDRSLPLGDVRAGRDHGVSGTPSFVISGHVINALDDKAVRAALDAALGGVP
ncbi:MAG: thioredoxin domain-containing protein [Candidatus Thermoplasmatota archaeon]